MIAPYFYRNHLARRYYLDHVNPKHKEFAVWDHKIQLIYGLVALTTAVSALLFFGALDGRFPSIYTSIFRDLLCLIFCRSSRLCLLCCVRQKKIKRIMESTKWLVR